VDNVKEIINWTITFEEEPGKRGIGLLLPGCIVNGYIVFGNLQVDIEVNVADVDTNNLVITSAQGEKYKLLDASRDYLQDIKKCIEIGLMKRQVEREGEAR